MRVVVLVLALGACHGCGHRTAVEPSAPAPAPAHGDNGIDIVAKPARRMVPPEVFLRSYLRWFGGLAPVDVQKRAHGYDLFDQWTDYLAALGLPDYHLDAPRVTQSNTMMLATIGRLSEALCVRAVEHDLRAHPPIEQRVVFAFDLRPNPSRDDFALGFDVLHRSFPRLSNRARSCGPV